MSDDLRGIQSFVQGCLLAPDRAAQTEGIRARILPSASLSPEAQLAVYQRGYLARLVQCMEGQFKALRHTLGPALFADFAADYLRSCPSRSPTLSELGAGFPAWLEATRPDEGEGAREPWVDFLIELARYEWTLYVKFDAEGHEGRALATAEAPDERLRPQPSLGRHRFEFPVDAYHRGVAAERAPEVPGPETVRLAILRRDFRIGVFRLTAPQWDLLGALLDGAPAPDALARTARAHGVTEAEAQAAWRRWRPKWIADGFFVADGA